MGLVWRDRTKAASRKQAVARDYCDNGPGGKGELRDILEMLLTELWMGWMWKMRKNRIQRDASIFDLRNQMDGGAISWAEEDCGWSNGRTQMCHSHTVGWDDS